MYGTAVIIQEEISYEPIPYIPTMKIAIVNRKLCNCHLIPNLNKVNLKLAFRIMDKEAYDMKYI